jgi:hypothetical protein
MANIIYIPFCNPVRFVELDPVQLPQYLTKHFDDYWASEQLQSFETVVNFTQKYQTNDTIYLQFESNFASIQMSVIDCEQTVLLTQAATQVRANKYLAGYYVYELTLSLAAFSAGTIWLKLSLGLGSKFMISEPIELAETWPNTILFQYSNSKYHGDVIFETGIVFGFRCEAVIRRLDPANERTAYRDQKLNPTTLKVRPFRGFELGIGHLSGVPDWVIDKMNWIWSCDNVLCDGKSFAVLDESKFEDKEIHPQYPFRQWALNIQEGINRASKIAGVDVDPNKKLLITAVADGTIFGDLSEQAGSNLVPILIAGE